MWLLTKTKEEMELCCVRRRNTKSKENGKTKIQLHVGSASRRKQKALGWLNGEREKERKREQREQDGCRRLDALAGVRAKKMGWPGCCCWLAAGLAGLRAGWPARGNEMRDETGLESRGGDGGMGGRRQWVVGGRRLLGR